MRSAPETLGSSRRADIDYLRVGALLLLIVYHVLLVYNSWDWWRVKSAHAGLWADYLLTLFTPWRMPLVFFVGGVAARFMMERAKTGVFISERATKLLTAFLFAIVALAPVQRYVRLNEDHQAPTSFLNYLIHQAPFAHPYYGLWLPDFAHAWFLPYLFIYSAAMVLFFRYAPRAFTALQRAAERTSLWALVGAAMAWWACVEAAVLPSQPISGYLFPDIGAHAKFLPAFVLGVLLAKSDIFQARLLRGKIMLWVVSGVLLALTLWFKADALIAGPDVLGAPALWFVARGLFTGVALFGVVAFASWTLNRPSPGLTYATDAILPIYLMHQTVLVVAADMLVQRRWPLGAEMATLLVVTLLLPLGVYHVLVRHNSWLRRLFGLRAHAREANPTLPPPPLLGPNAAAAP